MPLPYEYPNAGVNAPPGVQQEIDYFRTFALEERAKIPLLYYLLGSSTPPYKMSKPDATYMGESLSAQRCGNCQYAYQHVKTKRFICSQMRGDIKPVAWCRLWKA